ncbi:phosphonate C-P lyase system protein PhnH [Yoonia sp.]|uniref:phosphonate C-P lyase system protein PhnH n=1 Tax=Yoonia sp. TaxID=2212373 RepID=UPI001A039A4F|nr:phosphonate C-P lyase system protein PhnH [Yoonia sp.]MBE0413702.1 phosphonate C-P lyase system protein PhnH [Yoonia sp.]
MSVLDLPRLWRPATHQALFRRILDVAARPGQIADLGDLLDGRPAALAALATFCDNTQTLADLTGTLSATDFAFLDVGKATVDKAGFILSVGTAAPDFTPRLGTLDTPEDGATLVIMVDSLTEGAALTLTGPGINGTATLAPKGLAPDWLTARARWCADFPMGVDLVLADATRLTVIPRTTKIGA